MHQTLRDALVHGVEDRIAGNFADVKGMISNFTTFTKNAGFWLRDVAGVDAISVLDPASDIRSATLIDPYIVITADHFPIGDVVKFVAPDGTVETRTVSDFLKVGLTDFRVCLLTAPVLSIEPMHVATNAMMNKIYQYDDRPIPYVRLNQHREASIEQTASNEWDNGFGTGTPADTLWLSFHQAVIGGDSGSPMFLIVNSTAVLMDTILAQGIKDNHAAINAAMSTLRPGAALVDFDFSAFPDLVNGTEPMDLEDNHFDGNVSAVWTNGTNWSLGHKPTATERAIIDGNSAVNPDIPPTLQSCGGIWVDADTLDLGNVVAGTVKLTGGSELTLASFTGRFETDENGPNILHLNGASDSGVGEGYNSDPGESNVRSGVAYKIFDADKTGTMTSGGNRYTMIPESAG
jgi:hypothetical protein